jgi:molybdopterin synthase catalytic subunit
MRIRVLYFGILRDIAACASEEVELQDGANVADLLANRRARYVRLQQFDNSLAVAVNEEYASASSPLSNGDEVALLPPVSGG